MFKIPKYKHQITNNLKCSNFKNIKTFTVAGFGYFYFGFRIYLVFVILNLLFTQIFINGFTSTETVSNS